MYLLPFSFGLGHFLTDCYPRDGAFVLEGALQLIWLTNRWTDGTRFITHNSFSSITDIITIIFLVETLEEKVELKKYGATPVGSRPHCFRYVVPMLVAITRHVALLSFGELCTTEVRSS